MKLRYYLWLIVLLSCKDRYYPDIASTGTGYLVVEGVLNAGEGPTTITLSRTMPLNKSSQPVYESGATVSVEGSDNSTKALIMTSPGVYYNDELGLSPDVQYRVRIQTTDGKEYLSDFVKVKTTPPIDDIGWKQTNDGDVQVYVNTHDPANNTIYYKWDFDETWEIHSAYQSSLIYDPASSEADPYGVRPRIFPQEDVYRCWKYGHSTNILIASSAKLTSDVIYQSTIKSIPAGDEQLSVLYSVLVRQYALDKAAYEFYDLMKKNTESLGTIFDPMPSELRGNIHNTTNPNDIVIGFIAASTVTQKRAFVTSPPGWRFNMYCNTIFIPENRDSTAFYFKGAYIPINNNSRETPPAQGYDASTPFCVDCTTRGGQNQKPSYWP
ncbi:hypothetical protein A8C56_22415 [Niabella ginsenosidivorans]|uniref:DUF4249 domain-containing protein n=1 Tax=Niabella ginsenosidivorans TaxID=1176587 RepID=A0A1A9I9I4_9BACT|nr:DUF4249 domain-containing protein [Niabella ginsenosidivorans]ANH83372.1 hypothetical protein A8C56_22415 [Niabella ginsenosidivorans]